MRDRASLASLLLAIAASSCGSPPPIAKLESPIIGGTNDSSDPSVVMLVITESSGGQASCTGEIVSPHVLLTAAHCVDPQTVGAGATFDVFFGWDVNTMSGDPSQWIQASKTIYNTAFDPNSLGGGNDVGVAILDTASPVPPLPMNRAPITDAWVGQPIRLVGYGVTSGSDTTGMTAGTKRTVMSSLSSYDANFLDYGDATAGTCEGDSGGPAFMTVPNGNEVIAGITSFGYMGCAMGTSDTRIDLVAPWVDPWIAMFDAGFGGKANGASCAQSAECASTFCAPQNDGSNLCTVSCAPGACDPGFTCQNEQNAMICAVPPPSHGGGCSATGHAAASSTELVVALLALAGVRRGTKR